MFFFVSHSDKQLHIPVDLFLVTFPWFSELEIHYNDLVGANHYAVGTAVALLILFHPNNFAFGLHLPLTVIPFLHCRVSEGFPDKCTYFSLLFGSIDNAIEHQAGYGIIHVIRCLDCRKKGV